MLNKTLLALAAICCSASLTGVAQTRDYTFKEATPTPVAQLTSGNKYLIYDTYTSQGDRRALRFASGSTVGGNHVTDIPTAATSNYSATYVWIAEADENGNWKFKNLATNTYIPAVANTTPNQGDGSVTLSETPGSFTLTDAGNSAFYVCNVGAPEFRWDGNDAYSYSMAQWHNSTHAYQFYDAAEVPIVTVTYQKGDIVYGSTYTSVNLHSTFSTPALSEIGTPTETLTNEKITADRTITVTVADGVNPFKLVSARHRNSWATSSAAGLTHTANNANFAAGEWFFDVPASDYFKIYSPNQSKYLGTIGSNVNQVAFSDTPGTFKMQKSTFGAEEICNSDNDNPSATVYLNWRDNAIGSWYASDANGADAGSHWFMVYDEDAYNTNKDSFTETVNNRGYFQGNGILPTTIAEANAVYTEATSKTDLTDNENVIGALKTLIDKAATMRFGVAGNDIPQYLSDLNDAMSRVRALMGRLHITLNFPHLNGHAISRTIDTEVGTTGTTIGALIATLELPAEFTPDASVASQTVTGGNITKDIPGKWGFPAIEFDRVYRITLRNKDADYSCNYFYANGSTIEVHNGTNADAITPERLFYFKEAAGSTPNALKVTLHSLACPDNYGFNVGTGNNTHGSMSTNPTVFTVVSNSFTGTLDAFGFSLQHPDAANAHLNDISGTLGVWNHASSRNDNGSAFKLYNLSNDEIDAIEGVSDVAKAAAKTDPTVDNISALCVPAVKAELPTAYEEEVGVAHTLGGNISIPGYVSATSPEAVAVYNDCTSSEELPFRTMSDHLFNLRRAAYSYEATEGVLFTLPSTELDARGYLCNANGQVTNTRAANLTFDSNNDDFKFCFVTVDGKQYLYNLGADKFMNAFGEKTDNEDSNVQAAADYTWRFNEVPTEFKGMMLFTGSIAHSFTFKAGRTPSTNPTGWPSGQDHEGGLSMTNDGQRPVIVSMGIVGRGDGNGLIAKYAGKLTEDQLNALRTRITNALNATTAAKDAIPAEITEEKHIVNHYTPAAKALIQAAEGADYQAYLMETGERQGFVDGTAYTIVNAENRAWGINDEGACIQAEIGTDNAAYFNWIPAVVTTTETETTPEVAARSIEEGSRYTFSHTHDDATVLLEINNTTEHAIGTSTLGKVTIAGVDYVVTSNGNKASTTAITEISADGKQGATVVYDLQGRRLAAPVRGVNIINGRKVLVK